MTSLRYVTPKAVFDTVIYDGQTRLWFSKLCLIPAVVNKIVKIDAAMGSVYRKYRLYSVVMIVCGSVAICLVAAGFLSNGRTLWFFRGAGMVALVLAMVMAFARRRPLATLAARLIEIDLPDLPESITLYQLGEIYARRYQLPSLVDIIGQWNELMRVTFIIVYFATFGVFFLTLPWMLFWTVMACFLVLFVLGAVFMLRRSR